MSCIKTRSGIMFDPLAPKAEEIIIADIAHSLSMLCRANGHFKHFYSVGQHCINCAREAAARGYSVRLQLACLLHDGSEAYLSDVTRPVKAEIPKYLEIEEPLQEAIWNKFLGTPLTEEENRLVFDIDDAILYCEFLALMDTPLPGLSTELSSIPTIDFMDFAVCKETYLALFEKLSNAL